MRKSDPQTGSRRVAIRAGIAAVATAAAVVAGTATAAFAADTAVALSPVTAPVGGGTTVTASATGAYTGLTVFSARIVASSGTCPTTFGVTSTTNIAVAAVPGTTPANDVDVTVPALNLGAYKVCIYGVATGSVLSTTALAAHSSANLTIVAATPTLGAPGGPAAGGNQLTVTATGPYLTSATTLAAVLTTASTCPANYSAASPGIAAAATKSSASVATVTVPALTLGSRYKVCVYGGTTSTSALLGGTTATYAALPVVTLGPAVGPSGGTNTITVSAGTTSTLFTGFTPGVTVTSDPCPGTYATSSTNFSATVTKISNNKIAILIPTGVTVASGDTTTPYNVCVYGGTTGSDTLIATPATYTVAPVLTVSNTVSPSAGLASGGSTVVINGSGFPTDPDAVLSASIGGSPVTITSVNSAGTQITGTTSAHSPGTAAVTVTTAAGTKTSASATAYTYTYGIQIGPNTAPAGSTVTMDITGAGFASLTWTGATRARIFLVNDRYSAAGSNTTTWTTPPLADCTGVILISDQELLCTLNLTDTLTAGGTLTGTPTPVADGTYTIEVVNNGQPTATLAAYDTSIISSGSTFTVAPF
jgi:hypothetical protein